MAGSTRSTDETALKEKDPDIEILRMALEKLTERVDKLEEELDSLRGEPSVTVSIGQNGHGMTFDKGSLNNHPDEPPATGPSQPES